MIQCELQSSMALKIPSPIDFSKFHLHASEPQNLLLAVK